MNNNKRKMLFSEGKFFKFMLIFIAAVLLFGFAVMGLWNGVLTPVLHVSVINFWQAIGILVLSKILFGGFRGGWRGRNNNNNMWGMRQKWEAMSPEEREKFKSEWKNRCSRWGQRENTSSSSADSSSTL